MNIYTVTIFISILAYIVVGRQAPTLLIVGTLVAGYILWSALLACRDAAIAQELEEPGR